MTSRLPFVALAALMSVGVSAAPRYVPDRDGRWHGDEAPFVDSRSIQHDALAVGLDGVPGRPKAIADGVYLVAAPPPPGPAGAISDAAISAAASAAGRGTAVGGVSALARVSGVATDLGDVFVNRSYREPEFAADLFTLPHLNVEAVDLSWALPAAEEGGDLAWPTGTGMLAASTSLLLAVSLILAGLLMGRPPSALPRRGFDPLPAAAKALPPVRRHRRPLRVEPPGGDDKGPATAQRAGRTRVSRRSR